MFAEHPKCFNFSELEKIFTNIINKKMQLLADYQLLKIRLINSVWLISCLYIGDLLTITKN